MLRSGQFDDTDKTVQPVTELFLQVLELRKRAAKWPEIINTLNPANEHHIRTVLLEMRWVSVASPDVALSILENVCHAAKASGRNMKLLDLLETALVDVEKGFRN